MANPVESVCLPPFQSLFLPQGLQWNVRDNRNSKFKERLDSSGAFSLTVREMQLS